MGVGCQSKDRDPLWANSLINAKFYDKLQNMYVPKGGNDSTLIFESRFESGNLARAI